MTFKPGLIDPEVTIEDEPTRKFLQAYMERFSGFVAKLLQR